MRSALRPIWTSEVRPQTDLTGVVRPQTDLTGEVRPQTDLTGEVRPQTDLTGEVRSQTDLTGEVRPQTDLCHHHQQVCICSCVSPTVQGTHLHVLGGLSRTGLLFTSVSKSNRGSIGNELYTSGYCEHIIYQLKVDDLVKPKCTKYTEVQRKFHMAYRFIII